MVFVKTIGVSTLNNIKLVHEQKFKNRAEISKLLGGNPQSGITTTDKIQAILLFKNEKELYSDYFYPKGSYDYCMYTGIGRVGDQDNLDNKMYDLNIAVLSHIKQGKKLLLFEKRNDKYYFVGEYQLTETHQNIQPDINNQLRRVFVFHLKLLSDEVEIKIK